MTDCKCRFIVSDAAGFPVNSAGFQSPSLPKSLKMALNFPIKLSTDLAANVVKHEQRDFSALPLRGQAWSCSFVLPCFCLKIKNFANR